MNTVTATEATARAAFDEYAEAYDFALNRGLSISGEPKQYFAEGRIKRLADCLTRCGQHPTKILDFGCGTGANAPIFQRVWPDVRSILGVDVSPKAVEVAERELGSARVRFCLNDEYQPDESFDLAFSNGVFHHITLAERPGAADYVHRSLRPGGLFALWENNPWNPGTRYVMSRISFDRDAVPIWPGQARGMLQAAGFRILHTEFAFIFPRLLCWLRPLESRLSRLPIGAQYLVLGRLDSSVENRSI